MVDSTSIEQAFSSVAQITPHASFIPNDATRNATKTIANYVQQSQWRRAYRFLQQSPILPDTIPNRRAVAKLHPQRPPPSPHELRDAEGVTPFKTSRTIFNHVVRVANINRAAGIRCSGAAEMIGIVEVGGGDAIFTIVEALNDGTLHPDLYKAIEPSLLFALRKPQRQTATHRHR